MRNTILLISLIALLSLLINCTCPGDEQIGSVSLMKNSLIFNSYNGNETLIFEDIDGNQKEFTVFGEGLHYGNSGIVVEQPCSRNSLDYQSIYYLSEYYELGFEAMDCFFYYNLTTYNYVENGLYSRDTTLYDFFSLSGYIGNESNIDNIDIITSFRGNESVIPNDIENFSFKCDTTLILKRFENVYYIDEGPTFFFSPNTGVVGFYDGNKLWEITS